MDRFIIKNTDNNVSHKVNIFIHMNWFIIKYIDKNYHG